MSEINGKQNQIADVYSCKSIIDRIESVEKNNTSFQKIHSVAQKCADYRKKELIFLKGKPCCCVQSGYIIVYLEDLDKDFEHHAVHELCHVIAGSCGFSYNIDYKDDWKKLLSHNTPFRMEQQDAIEQLVGFGFGSYFTHIAVNKISYEAGYKDKNWDQYLLDELNAKTELYDLFITKTHYIGLAIQYKALESLKLPGLEANAFIDKLQTLLPKFKDNLNTITSKTYMLNPLDAYDCLKSTKSLAKAFADFINYPLDQNIDIQIACHPTSEWNIDTIIDNYLK